VTARHAVIGRGHLTVVGNPGSRRVSLFSDALRAAGLPAPAVLPWHTVLGGAFALTPGTAVRIDSPGEDPGVDRLLRGSVLPGGFAPARVEGTAVWYRGFTAALGRVAAAVRETPGATLLADPAEIAIMFDKRRSHALLHAAGVPVPRALEGTVADPVRDWADLRRRLADAGLRRVFVKPAHASSASGVMALEFGSGGRLRATSSVELERTTEGTVRLWNSLKVRCRTDEADAAAIVDALAPDGLHVEQWIPKVSQGCRAADLRVVVTAGRATHAVVRTSGSPMTNLHLGGSRGDLTLAREAAGPAWPALLETCERAAACFPRATAVGVDLLPAAGWRSHFVGEVNAFGDLLPGLTGLPGSGAEGLDTYAAQVAAITTGPAVTTAVDRTAVSIGAALCLTP
jgi:glutathione synthase/RimK-type ligase-like ATP-grasp enzyme